MSATVFSLSMHTLELVAKGYLPLESGAEEKVLDFIPGLPGFPMSDFPKEFAAAAATASGLEFVSSLVSHSKTANRVLLNSFQDLESSIIDALRGQQFLVDNIGPLLPSVHGNSTKTSLPTSLLPEDHACLDWLDTQDEASVLFVSFGSLQSVEEETLHELAHGFEASGERFLWVIRPDVIKTSLADLLPEGFQSRTGDRSHIISWAPQLAVLAHRAVGAFLTHCGWNSTIESLYMGVPMIGFPQGAEQNTNLKCIKDWKVGMALGGEGNKCSREAVERAVRSVMRGEEGKGARRRARELKELARKATEEGSKAKVAQLVEELKHGKLKPKVAAETGTS